VFRIDPLTEDGVFDGEFFSSKEYSLYAKKVEWYLKIEGFEDTTNEIVIRMFDHLWIIKHNPFKNNL
jgi:hypothetical protein